MIVRDVPLVFLAAWLDESGVDVWRGREGWSWALRQDLQKAAPRVLGGAVAAVVAGPFKSKRACMEDAADRLWGSVEGCPAPRAVFEATETGELIQ